MAMARAAELQTDARAKAVLNGAQAPARSSPRPRRALVCVSLPELSRDVVEQFVHGEGARNQSLPCGIADDHLQRAAHFIRTKTGRSSRCAGGRREQPMNLTHRLRILGRQVLRRLAATRDDSGSANEEPVAQRASSRAQISVLLQSAPEVRSTISRVFTASKQIMASAKSCDTPPPFERRQNISASRQANVPSWSVPMRRP